MPIINNALSGALAAQVALTTSSHNIANLQTKGYTRQAALLTTVGADANPRSPGNGVQASSLLRFSDNYKSQAMWRAAAELGSYSQAQPYLNQLEQVMGDDTASLSAGIDKFFGALNAAAGEPGSTPLREQVLTAANLMAERFNGLNNVFNAQLESIRNQRSAIVDAANAQIATIARLNTQISEAQAGGLSASAMIDARDQAIDELASKMALEVSDNGDGTRNVSLKTGQALVLNGVHGTLAATTTKPQAFSLTFAGSTFALDAGKLGGQLGGLTKYETEKVIPLQTDIGNIAEQMSIKINAQLVLGYKADGAAGSPPTASAGQALFVYTPGNNADMLKIAPGFKYSDLAFSGDGNPGDTGNLKKLVAVKSQSITVGSIGSVLLSDADAQLVGKLGVDSQLNKAGLKTTQTVRTQSIDDWQSTSGVNQDEEAVNLVEYQNMYQANMKVIAVANQLFDATLAMMG
ncbi:flagellar hook-associated protein FlgK [Massilia sp. IC2-476]|uniref:flagellar hook-associated protein FlgK n=1 Tax=Massilia sp. IC2-476 TaxID=2887199 RepID=UPI001D11E97B|nr:flagellar hook-associated protein FlgK [Massilia sp. IC2-476]MCC2971740.1 flagellar hook-associated protein FlgK [Massilia sp. IC2-476]